MISSAMSGEILLHFHGVAVENIRHIFTTFISWYIFFWTLNAGILGWLYQSDKVSETQEIFIRRTGHLITGLFVLLNVLSVIACWFCYKAVESLTLAAIDLGHRLSSSVQPVVSADAVVSLIPIQTFQFVFIACGVSLALNTTAWACLPAIRRR